MAHGSHTPVALTGSDGISPWRRSASIPSACMRHSQRNVDHSVVDNALRVDTLRYAGDPWYPAERRVFLDSLSPRIIPVKEKS